MKKLLTLATVALVALAMGVTAQAKPEPTKAALERKVTWQEQHIRQLNHRRAYLHRYIRHLRRTTIAKPAPTTTSTSSATSTTSSSSSTSYTSSGSGWADELRAVGFPESAIPHMLFIIDRESGGNPNAVNPSSGACGLVQLWPCTGGSAWLDPMTNLRLGYQKYQAAGFAPWGG